MGSADRDPAVDRHTKSDAPAQTATYCPTCTEGIGDSVTTRVGSRYVFGSSTEWLTANRGPGDILNVTMARWMAATVMSDTELYLERPIAVGGGSGLAYFLKRQETSAAGLGQLRPRHSSEHLQLLRRPDDEPGGRRPHRDRL